MPGVKKRMSQIFGGIKKGYPADTKLGGHPVCQVMKNPAAASVSAVHGAMTLTTSAQEITSAITDPVHYRNLTVSGNQSNVYANVTIYGKNWAGESINETILASGTTLGVGILPFKEVDFIQLPVRTATGQTVVVGIGDKLGLERPCTDSALTLLKVAGSAEVEAAIDVVNGTFTPTTVANGSRLFEVFYHTDVF